MRKKFVQIVSLSMLTALLLACFAPVAAAPAAPSDLGSRLMRIGIYYAENGKSSVELKLTAGDGFEFGVYDGEGNFSALPEAAPAAVKSVTVQVDAGTNFGFAVFDTATGAELCRYDDRGLGTGLAVRPYSLSGERTVTKCGYPYYGAFRFERFSANNDLMTIVNYVCLDDYVEGVVPYEMSASWPLEALKVQAVCARTYALTRINATHQNNYHFDLCDATHCQVYKGVYSGAQADKVVEAVRGTSGVTVQYNGKYCETVYSSSNGGASESNINVNGRDYPYLIGKLDPYEALIADSIPNYHWSKSFTAQELRSKLVADGYETCGPITGVQTTLSPTGNVIALTFLDANGKSYTIYRNRCRTFLSLRSLRYSVTGENGATAPGSGGGGLVDSSGGALDFSKGVSVIDGSGNISTVTGGYVITASGVQEIAAGSPAGPSPVAGGSVYTFTGTGWGHNVGMSQYGANAMAQQGYGYQEILEFYYTGVTVG